MSHLTRHWVKILAFIIFLMIAALLYLSSSVRVIIYESIHGERDPAAAALTAQVKSPFTYYFSVAGTLSETGSLGESSSPYFWLNSGGQFTLEKGTGKTIQGELAEYSKWRVMYSKSSPVDTDNGYHPQNLFRFITRSKWQNFNQEIQFKVNKTNLSSSPERDAWSGVLMFLRYEDSDNLYYAGLRMDGKAVIKKKINGTYFTLAETPFFLGHYNRDTNPTLIPQKTWLKIKTEIITNPNKSVTIRVYADKDGSGDLTLAVEGTDDGKSFGGPAILDSGHAGLRGDFMDLEFDNYAFSNL